MKRILGLLVVTILVWSCSYAFAGQAKVSLKGQVQVKSEGMVHLSDIASVQGTPAQKRALGDVVVLIAPKPGCTKIIAADYVQRKLDSVRFKDVQLDGASEVSVEGECVRIESADLLEQAKSYLTGLLPVLSAGTYSVSVVKEPEELIIPVGSKVEILPRLMFSEPKTGPNYILLDAKVDGKVMGTARATLRAVVMVEALTASATIRKGEVISTRNTSLRQVEAANGKEYLNADLFAGQEPVVSSRTIMPGSVISGSDVTSQLAVKKGDVVTLIVRCGSVKLATSAEAKEGGCRGDNISVRSDISTADVRAKIVEPGIVEIKR
jgi:flagella basal body P-ring formation protein FlgA